MKNGADILTAAFDSFTTKLDARPGFSLPARRTIQAGQLVFDSEEFTVHAIGSYQGAPGQRVVGYQIATGGLSLFSFEFGVTIVRLVPVDDNVGNPPSVAEMTASGLLSLEDGAALTDTFYAAMADSSIVGECDFAYFGGISWLGPSGGLIGTMLTCAVQM